MPKLSHFDDSGAAHMVDVSGKDVTERIAIAEGQITMCAEAFALIKKGTAKKGDVLGVARLAAIMAAKRTSGIIPLCHPLPLAKVGVEFAFLDASRAINIEVNVKTNGQTGVEMEALHAASVGLLTIYDMVKAVDKGMVISNIRLVHKEGGKSGLYQATK
ncbi:MAG: cyclic pyranopterin monophosphate synthase MoaC [Pseudomonadota bacterium]